MSIELGMPGIGASHVKEVSCSSCTSLCCRKGVKMELNPDEVACMEAAGTELSPADPPSSPGQVRRLLGRLGIGNDKHDYYALETDCGNLVEDPETGTTFCGAHDDSRPQVCIEFSAGSYGCRTMRFEAEVDTPQEFVAYLDATQS